MYLSGEVFSKSRLTWNEVPSFFTNKRFVLFDPKDNKHRIFQLKPERTAIDLLEKETVGQALLVRRKDFKYM
jgi:hypothetical protein